MGNVRLEPELVTNGVGLGLMVDYYLIALWGYWMFTVVTDSMWFVAVFQRQIFQPMLIYI